MNPLITKALNSTSKRFDEEFSSIRGKMNAHSGMDGNVGPVKQFLLQSNLELLAAVREEMLGVDDLTHAIQMENDGNFSYKECERMAKAELFDRLLTALSEGNKNNII